LDRLSMTLSGGEAQRIQLATCLGSRLVGACYVLDEPSIGLHSRDTERLVKILHELRDLGNTVLVVEHDPDVMRAADHIVDLGPGAGEHGGHVTAAGNVADFTKSDAITAQYLRGEKRIDIPMVRRQPRSGNPLLPSAVPRTVAVAPVPVKTKKGAKTAEAKAAKPRKARSI
jgi:excinuclease ABC subunit A